MKDDQNETNEGIRRRRRRKKRKRKRKRRRRKNKIGKERIMKGREYEYKMKMITK